MLIMPVDAYELSASPDIIELDVSSGKKACRKLTVSSEVGNISLSSKWSVIKSRKLTDFIYRLEDVNVTLVMPSNIIYKRDTIELCVTVPDAYAYYGVILIEDQSKTVGLGVWLTINPRELVKSYPELKAPETYIKKSITGRTISRENESKTNMEDYLMISTMSSSLILITLVVWLRQKRRAKRV